MRHHCHATSRTLLFVLLLVGFTSLATAQEPEGKIDERFLLLMGARNATKAGMPHVAVKRYRALLTRNPHLHEIQQELGWVLMATGQLADAEQQFRLVLDAHPDNTQAWTGLLETLRKTNKHDEILTTLTRLVDLEPLRKDMRMQLALELHNRGKFVDAERHIAVLLGE